MPYSTIAGVKKILQIAETDVSQDYEIAGCIISADGHINGQLTKVGLSLPTAPYPQNLIDASGHFAAWLFRRRRDPAGSEAFKVEGDMFLTDYLEANGVVLTLGEEAEFYFQGV